MKRSTRVADLLQKEISYIILRELKDPRIGFVTVTGVSVSDDLKYAKVFVSVMGQSEEVERTFDGLKSATGFIQGCIGRRVRLRYTPEISFRLDESVSYGAHIEQLLRDIKKESPEGCTGVE
ncbi:MAG: 30S ribosome-binding factor RbfA [bacterium]